MIVCTLYDKKHSLTILAGWFSLPLQLIWLSSAFTIVGGGSTVAAAVSMMIIADATPKAMRSVYS
jgi:hypothetical protein